MVRVCSGNTLPHGVKGKWYLLRPARHSAHEIWDVTDPGEAEQTDDRRRQPHWHA
jgi:hypothetical protein